MLRITSPPPLHVLGQTYTKHFSSMQGVASKLWLAHTVTRWILHLSAHKPALIYTIVHCPLIYAAFSNILQCFSRNYVKA